MIPFPYVLRRRMMVSGNGIILPPAGNALEAYTWPEIDAISKAGLAADYWAIGSTKTISLEGSTKTMRIIGFDHDDLADGSGKAGITFDQVDFLGATYALHSSSTNTVSWRNCALRTTLQSTTFETLDSELKSVIKPVIKKTSAGNKSTTIIETTDTLFLLSQIEVMNSRANSAAGEGTNYKFYATASNRTKASNWWTRSPSTASTFQFLYINSSGTATTDSATSKRRVSIAFCV